MSLVSILKNLKFFPIWFSHQSQLNLKNKTNIFWKKLYFCLGISFLFYNWYTILICLWFGLHEKYLMKLFFKELFLYNKGIKLSIILLSSLFINA